MASLDILCSNLLNLKNKITKIEHKNIFCGPSKILKNISWPIHICLKYFMIPTKALRPPPTYVMYGPLNAIICKHVEKYKFYTEYVQKVLESFYVYDFSGELILSRKLLNYLKNWSYVFWKARLSCENGEQTIVIYVNKLASKLAKL